jgi:ATP-dependent RNA helicase SUPV3L1/SUV3
MIPVPEQQIRQIAGRAGRFKTAHEKGLVTCAKASDFALLQAALSNTLPAPYQHAFVAPSFNDLDRLQAALPLFTLADILDAFIAFAQPPAHYSLAEMKTVRKLLQLLQGFDLRALELEDLFTFMSAPVKVESDTVASAFLSVITFSFSFSFVYCILFYFK